MAVRYLKNGEARLNTRDSYLDYADVLEKRVSFDTYGALWGERLNPEIGGCIAGRMSGEDAAAYLDTPVDYVVYSFDTPIAYHDANTGEWTVPDARYSVTTSRHQGRIRAALYALEIRAEVKASITGDE